MKKAIASGLIGLMALGGSAAVAAPVFAQEVETEQSDETRTPATDEERAERQAARSERKAEKLATMADLLGVSVEDLQAARESGSSIADLAADQGVDVQVVIDALVASKQAHIDEKLAAGDIDADRAAEISDSIEERVTARVNGEATEGRRGHGHRGFGNAPAAPTA